MNPTVVSLVGVLDVPRVNRLVLLFCIVSSVSVPAQSSDQSGLMRLLSYGTVGGSISAEFRQLYSGRYGAGTILSLIPGSRPGMAFLFSTDFMTTNLLTTEVTALQMIRQEAGLQFRRTLGDRGALFVQALGGYGGARLQPAPDDIVVATASGFSYRAGVGPGPIYWIC